MSNPTAYALSARPYYDDAPKVFIDPDAFHWSSYESYIAWCRACTPKKKPAKLEFDRNYYAGGVLIAESRDPRLQADFNPSNQFNAAQGLAGVNLSLQPDNPTTKVGNDLSATLAERKTQHGDFTDHARASQAMKREFDKEHLDRVGRGQPALSDTQLEAAHMILHKLARIVAGDANHLDHWHDIAGYATITAERIK